MGVNVIKNSLLIKNANIVDGSGEEAFKGDVSIEDGIISDIGSIKGEFETIIEANGLTLTPGFIDIHTHFDPQLCWDGYATPSIEHGVTTVVTGNCSLSLAPIRNGGEEKIISMFQVIEDVLHIIKVMNSVTTNIYCTKCSFTIIVFFIIAFVQSFYCT